MAEQSIFHLISDITHKQGVSCILIGGFAVNYYKVSRQTADVDFLITKDDFDKIIPSLEHLIALKLHSIKYNPKMRLTRDLPDIINLIKMNAVNFTDKKFKELCLKFGTDEIYNRILEALE